MQKIWEHMRGLGLGALAHANWHANYHSFENSYWPELSVLQAAHAAEILIKARIAQEHPLLIFEQLPKVDAADTGTMQLSQLIQRGRTAQFADLPDRLWATTGIRLPALARFKSFGRLRNTIQHFGVPDDTDLGLTATQFIFEVVDPFIHECWQLYAVDQNEDHEPYVYFVAGLIRRGVRFLVSPSVVEHIKHTEIEWPSDASYKRDMSAALTAAGANL